MARIYKFPNGKEESTYRPSLIEKNFFPGFLFLTVLFAIFVLLNQFHFRGGSFLFLLFMSFNIAGCLTVLSFLLVAKFQEMKN